MNRYNTRVKGKYGEEKAIRYLSNNGYRIVEKNYRNTFGEIDIVAREDDTIVFIEVKTRNISSYGPPEAAVDLRKQHRICKVAAGYINEKKLSDQPVRFDVVSISGIKIELIKDAFDLQEGLW